jgi:protein HOOK3
MAETELDKQTTLITDLTRKVDELQVEADKAAKLKDQVDECVILQAFYLGIFNQLYRYRHAADKLQKTENVMEKYKKKLQEGADLRQHVKVISLSIFLFQTL